MATIEAPTDADVALAAAFGSKGNRQGTDMTNPSMQLETVTAQAKGGTMRKEAPEPLLMEMWVTRPTVRPSGRRILATGHWWRYTDSDYRLETNKATGQNQLLRIPVEEGWWDSECSLTPDEVAKLEDAIRTSGVMDLPAETPPSPGGVIGGSDVYYTFVLDGKRHRIHYLEGGDEVPEPIDTVEKLSSRVIFNSQQRWLRDRGEEHSPLLEF